MVLLDFVAGTIVRRKEMITRPSYSGNKVIDMDRLKRDWKFNDVSDRSFFYLDRDFFNYTPEKGEKSVQKKEPPAKKEETK